MITTKEIEHLATLARIKIGEDEKKGLAKEIDSILAYVDEIKKATVSSNAAPTVGVVHNVFREDVVDSTSDEDKERLMKEAPNRVGDFIAVKKIL